MKCPNCGAENDAANRFCEQCGAQLPATAPGAQATMADAPTISTATACPTCGAQVLPGQAFCDECGAALPAAVATTAQASAPSSEANYQDVNVTNGSQPRGGGAAVNLVCPVCGHQNLPGDQFCDNCGAALTGTAPATTSQQSGSNSSAAALFDSEAPTMVDTSISIPERSALTTIPDMPPAKPSEPVEEPPSEPAPPREEPPAPNVPEHEPTSNPPLEAPPAQEPEPMNMSALGSSSDTLLNELLNPATASAPATMDMATYEAERKRLEDEISRQQQIIAQLEPVQNALGAATPAGVTGSLQQARDALQQAQHTYDTLQPPAPAIDPAEVARLEDEISRQQQIIAQLEPVQNALGAATPAGVAESIQQARDALQQAQTALAALQGGAAAPPATPAPEPTNAPEPRSLLEEVAAPVREAAMAASQQAPAQTEAAPAPEAAPAAPRFVLDDGKEITLPPNKQEIIIGREDPISGVYPEIDLTPYGGESGGVSRQHARMNHADGQWTITDLNSTNYTRVDGNKIEPNTPVPVQDGSRVQLGRVAMTFHAQ